MKVRTRFKIRHDTKAITLADDHRAVIRGEPLFRTQVRSARDLPHLLIEGDNNRKLGSHWSKGWPGVATYSLSLPERSSCPASCPVWNSCYGNTQPYTIRIKPDRYLIPKLRAEVANLAAFGKLFSVRLHALGDFYSVEYARFWIDTVRRHSNVYAFGFTAWGKRSEIGSIINTESRKWDRFRIRFSGSTGKRSSTVMIDPPPGRHAAGITCPVEVSREKPVPNCGSCGLCLSSKDPIVFRLH